jgi:hypothetical protein
VACHVDEADLAETVDESHAWFRDVNKAFVERT